MIRLCPALREGDSSSLAAGGTCSQSSSGHTEHAFPLLGEQGQCLWFLFDSCRLWSMAGGADPVRQRGELEALLGNKEAGQRVPRVLLSPGTGDSHGLGAGALLISGGKSRSFYCRMTDMGLPRPAKMGMGCRRLIASGGGA